MANKKKSKGGQRKSRKGSNAVARPQRRKTTNGGNHGNMKLMKQVCSITDPFCHAAEGSKYPDASSLKTLAWKSEVFVTVNCDNGGRAAIIFSADPESSYTTVASYLPGMVISTLNPWAPMPGWSNWTTGGVSYRVVSMGLELRSVASAMDNQGSLGIACIPAAAHDVILTNTDLNATNFGENTRISANSNKQLTAISHNDGIISKEFKATQVPVTGNATSAGNDVLIAYIVGGTGNTTNIEARLVVNYELSFSKNTIFNQIATPSAVENTMVTTGSNYVKRVVDQVVVGGAKELESRVMKAANVFGGYAMRSAASAVGGYFGGPVGAVAAGSMAGMIMDVD